MHPHQDRKRKREEEKNKGPAETATEATKQMLQTKVRFPSSPFCQTISYTPALSDDNYFLV